MAKKKTNATDDEKLHNLTNADWKFLNKMLGKYSDSIVNTVNDFTCEVSNYFAARLVVVEQLLCTLFEKQGKNPISECETLRLFYEYSHNSIISDVPGLQVRKGRVFDELLGKDVTNDFIYSAKQNNLRFDEVLSQLYKNIDNDEPEGDQHSDNDEPEYYQHFDNDEANEESSKSDDEEHRSSQALEA
ncbi:MAG: hypothetical protein E7074_03425 [Bacteroidales bacterium]|nr:hypothetical protein [Bacteroidales bacterium]